MRTINSFKWTAMALIAVIFSVLAACDEKKFEYEVPELRVPMEVATLNPTSVTENSVELNGELSRVGSYPISELFFAYWEQGDMDTRKTIMIDTRKEGEKFSHKVEGLKSYKGYAYVLTAKNEKGERMDGDVFSFTTKIAAGIEAPKVENGNPLDVGFARAEVAGRLLSDGNSDQTEVTVVAWRIGEPGDPTYGSAEIADDGTYTATLEGLDPGQTYEYKPVAQNELSSVDGETKTFKTTNTIYVDATAPDGGTGSTWDKALNSIKDAVGMAEPGISIWVASTAPYMEHNIRLNKKGISLIGGFKGDETSLDQRPAGLRSVIDGHWDSGGKYAHTVPNHWEVVNKEILLIELGDNNRKEEMLIQDFELTRANNRKGAVFIKSGSPIFKNILFKNNIGRWGSCVHYRVTDSQMIDCVFEDNISKMGAVHSDNNSFNNKKFLIKNCLFKGNEATEKGGAIFAGRATTIRDCVFENNTSKGPAAVVWIADSSCPTYQGTNILVGENTSSDGKMCAGGPECCPNWTIGGN
ncbi:hypothetical protein FUAX_07420 [Fulvitalea axinellae]|uniref:Fibronectin type-III domain-containing protein n=1 Tax=Fulvitalea axinellae TaxID=1182444 RepID=A0AAU9D7W9_9BACT|nr:hypothetical protein FUAX_07420 [Fulvitalea axinellae]